MSNLVLLLARGQYLYVEGPPPDLTWSQLYFLIAGVLLIGFMLGVPVGFWLKERRLKKAVLRKCSQRYQELGDRYQSIYSGLQGAKGFTHDLDKIKEESGERGFVSFNLAKVLFLLAFAGAILTGCRSEQETGETHARQLMSRGSWALIQEFAKRNTVRTSKEEGYIYRKVNIATFFEEKGYNYQWVHEAEGQRDSDPPSSRFIFFAWPQKGPGKCFVAGDGRGCRAKEYDSYTDPRTWTYNMVLAYMRDATNLKAYK